MRFFGLLASVTAALAAAALFLWPVPIEPVRWTPPPDRGFTGPFAANDALRGVERMLQEEVFGPDFLLVDRLGDLVTVARDGRILRIDPEARTTDVLSLLGGPVLGFAHAPVESWLGADPIHGLAVARGRRMHRLSLDDLEPPLRYAADVAIDTQGRVYVLEASSRHDFRDSLAGFLEHGAFGRLIAYDDINRASRVIVDELHMPTGLALGPDDAFVLISETSAYRVIRYWLDGRTRRQREVFIGALPGFPSHITWNGRDTFWLALYGPRIGAFDRWADRPWMRKVLYRVSGLWSPRPDRHAIVLGLDVHGRVVHNLQYRGADAYAPVTSVREHEGWLYLGSLERNGIARIPVPETRP